MPRSLLIAIAAIVAIPLFAFAEPQAPVRQAADRLLVHEWGTFTVLQDEQGKPIGGINTDDEPLPSFVHDLHGMMLQSPTEMPPVYFKGWPQCDRDVWVRLETPVIYFHPPAGAVPVKLDVEVGFNGGWLTQFYPDANASAPGLKNATYGYGAVTDKTVGGLIWHDLAVAAPAKPFPAATEKSVAGAPRHVAAADLTTPSNESERFLFYRGVGHLKAPLSVSRDSTGQKLVIRSDMPDVLHPGTSLPIGPLWLLDVRADGTSAMRTLDVVNVSSTGNDVLGEIAAGFAESNYSKDTLAAMRKSLHAALVRDGLFDDEADALLDTWDVSYFRRPGLRLFFMTPAVWTQRVLPLHVSQSADISRVMVGRIELTTPGQRALLAQIAAGPASQPNWLDDAMKKMTHREDYFREDWYQKLYDGRQSLLDLKLEMPPDYHTYLSLGRFRNALILDELDRRPTEALKAFVTIYGLGGVEKVKPEIRIKSE